MSNELDAAAMGAVADRVRSELVRHLPGLDTAIDQLLIAYLANGHALLEGPPGIGKTLLARTFALVTGGQFARIQFTPDLMPADVLGANVFDPADGRFRLVRGPIFTEVLMADEINRTPPKTQAALLEAMQERRVTIDGEVLELSPSFFVVATQNPIEFEGTYPLPEAQLDRFTLRIVMGHPPREAELELYQRAAGGRLWGWSSERSAIDPVVIAEELAGLRRASETVHVAEELLDYLYGLVAAVRSSPHVELGPSPRAGLALLEVARARAVLAGRDFVAPDDLKSLAGPCWGHRILVRAESELEGASAVSVVDEATTAVEVPQ